MGPIAVTLEIRYSESATHPYMFCYGAASLQSKKRHAVRIHSKREQQVELAATRTLSDLCTVAYTVGASEGGKHLSKG